MYFYFFTGFFTCAQEKEPIKINFIKKNGLKLFRESPNEVIEVVQRSRQIKNKKHQK